MEVRFAWEAKQRRRGTITTPRGTQGRKQEAARIAYGRRVPFGRGQPLLREVVDSGPCA